MDPPSANMKIEGILLKPKLEESLALCNEMQNPLTSRSRLRALCLSRWEYLMDVRKGVVEVGEPLRELDKDIERAYDAAAWPEIDTRIRNHVDFSFLCLSPHFTQAEQISLWQSVTVALYTSKTRETCEECMEEFKKLNSMRDQMTALKMDTTSMNREIKKCFQPLKQFQNPGAHVNQTDHGSGSSPRRALSTKKENEKRNEIFVKAEDTRVQSSSAIHDISIQKTASLYSTKLEVPKPGSIEPTQVRNRMAITASMKAEAALISDIANGDISEVDHPNPQALPSPVSYLASANKISIVHALNLILASVKKGGPADATFDYSNHGDDSVPQRKKRKRHTSATKYKRCSVPFSFPLNAVGDGFLHLKPLPHYGPIPRYLNEVLNMVFDVLTQHLTITHRGESLSAIWSNLKVPATGIHRIERADLHAHADRLVRLHYLDIYGKDRILEAQMVNKDHCKALFQRLQDMTGCNVQMGNFKAGEDKVFKSPSISLLPDRTNIDKLPVRQIEVEAAGLKILWNFRDLNEKGEHQKYEVKKATPQPNSNARVPKRITFDSDSD